MQCKQCQSKLALSSNFKTFYGTNFPLSYSRKTLFLFFLFFCSQISVQLMEKQRSDNGRRNRQARANDSSRCKLQRASSLPPVARAPPPPANELKLAAIAVDLNVRLRSADMPPAMQERAIRRARALVDANPDKNKRPNPTQLAMCLKKEFDALYGPAWHCIAGKSFGSFVTHASGGFLYFSLDKLCFLLFKTEVRPVVKPPTLLRLKINNA